MQRDGATALAMRDLDPDPEQITELALERGKIGIDRPRRTIPARRLNRALGARKLFNLAHR